MRKFAQLRKLAKLIKVDQQINESKITQEQLAYFASAVDSLGCMTISKYKRRVDATLLIYDSNEDLIDLLNSIFLGTKSKHENSLGTIIYTIKYQSKNLTHVLNLIKPFLRSKAEHAEVLLEVRRLCENSLRQRRRPRLLPLVSEDTKQKGMEEAELLRKELYLKSAVLNRKRTPISRTV
jgi:hypothetical protein